ncbi:aspartyl/asparaginyl beta-hydroxylase domain-containing protein [Pseudoalteromonas sp. SWXJZ94C]|uniref:aspartyl/asparaginyl beta-hydroxylase domain-containing protein n=1 Tax=unclassified Pseudoalteromonas TaxID=194690 RepID=UPI00140B8AA3|nr:MULTISPECIES: aspartyl/asparaginyl beta-hydroxylase domain-containing protein [unclassified Pseudoalteromonas]MBH0056290.1 aspartyl/asparaginyl beta-hydroxylase domain-containing protein [Pseudoalteromonas sp. SWXJZ94C]
MFIEPSRFPFVSELEVNWEKIRDEFRSLSNDVFDPWIQQQMHGYGWSVFGLHALGIPIESACKKCPETARLIQSIDGVSLAGFSLLAPQTHIEPHVGWAESVYRLHLGLVVPSECKLRVGSETRYWEEGKCLIFDDTVEHEAWNGSDQFRGTLMLDFLRPGITDFSTDMLPEEVRLYAERLINRCEP